MEMSIELTNHSIIVPMRRGFCFVRRRVDLEDIDIFRSQCSFWRGSYLRTYDGKKIILHSVFLGMVQVRDMFARIRQMTS